MSSKEIEVTCPHCATQLVVDVRTQQVLRTARPVEGEGGPAKPDPSRWDSAQSRVHERTSGAEDKLADALGRERERRATFEDRFREAQRRAAREPELPPEEEDAP